MKTSKNFWGKALSIALLSQFLWPHSSAFAATSSIVEAYGVDTVAGYSTILSSSQTSSPQQGVTFKIKKPDGDMLSIPAKTNDKGIAKVDLSDYHTRKAGQYFVSMVMNGIESEPKNFAVYADKINPDKSSLTPNQTVAKPDGIDQISLLIKIVDQYENPLAGHQINVTSNRHQDKITPNILNGLTDKNGIITFSVSSGEAGIATLAAIDTTANTNLTARSQIAFIDADHYLADAGGSFGSFIDVAKAAGGSLSHFDITDLPSTIQPGQNISFKLTAQDDSNQAVQNYTGKIHFSAEGTNSNNVSLPEDYTFKAEDLGVHQFSLGLSFTSAGTYKIVATDLTNPLVKGEKNITVGGGGNGSGSSQQPGDALKPTIETPSAGTYSQKIQTISGSAPAGFGIKIFDNDQEIGSVQVNNSGKYTYQTGSLADGIHKIYVTTLDQAQTVKGTSDTVQFNIDSTAPTVDDLTLQPTSGIQVSQVVTIDVTTEENLSQAATVFNGDIIQLNPSVDKPGHYIGSVQAPDNAGIYPIDIILVDQLGNEGSYKAKAQITVGNGSTTEQLTQESSQSTQLTQETQQSQETQQNLNPPPSKVSGLLSYAADKKITLVWDAASDNTVIKHYRVTYGSDPANLNQYVDTKDASTTWYVPNLQNGKEYYFALTAFDDEGAESAARSEVISGIPFATETSVLPKPVEPLNNVGGNDNLHGAFDQAVSPRIIGKPGPEIIWILSGAGFMGTMIQRLKKKRK